MVDKDLRNIKLILQYEGTDYSGWQIQSENEKCKMKNVKLRKDRVIITIQGILQEVIKKIAGEDVKVIGGARTDAGVHAIEQTASFKTNSRLDVDTLKRAINANLPHDIRVIETSECPMDFHPRYDAKSKTYFYIISESYSVFLRRYSWQIPYTLDCELMRQAGEYLIGEYDFSSFKASGCSSKNPIRRIDELKIEELSTPLVSPAFLIGLTIISPNPPLVKGGRRGFVSINTPVIKISISANAFLRHMARNIVGTLVEVGRGKFPPLHVAEILSLKDRRLSGPTAPAQGLFLEKIIY